MSKKKITLSEWILRFLIILLFCVALYVGYTRLNEWHELQQEKEELEQEKNELEEGKE
jgi:uncharacterized membrane protein